MNKYLRRSAGIVVIPAVAVLALAGCGNTIDPDQIEPQILSNAKSVYSEIKLNATEARCPSGVEAKVNQTFDCTITIDGNSDTVVTGTVTSVQDNVFNFDIEVKTAYIPMASIESAIADGFNESLETETDLRNVDFEADCGDKEVFSSGETFTCAFAYNGVDVGTVEYIVDGKKGKNLVEEGESNLDEDAIAQAIGF